MNQDNTTNRDDELHALLKTWRVEESLPPRFAESVWRRIAHGEARDGGITSWWIQLIRWWELSVRRPAFAAAYLGVLLAMGISIGLWQAESYAHSTEQAWRTAYVQSVTPTATVQP